MTKSAMPARPWTSSAELIKKAARRLRNSVFSFAVMFEDSSAAQKKKSRTRRAACGKIGHRAGDALCGKSAKIGVKKFNGAGKKGGACGGKGKSKGRAYYVPQGEPTTKEFEQLVANV